MDCTGDRLLIRRASREWDKIAYVVKGKEYGTISLGQNTPTDYASYDKMKAEIHWRITVQLKCMERGNNEV